MAEGRRVNDPLRVDYYRKHLRAIRDAIASNGKVLESVPARPAVWNGPAMWTEETGNQAGN